MKTVKHILSILLTLCMVLGMIPGTVFAANSDLPFTDVKETDWFYDAVQYVYENNLMSGTGSSSFSPDATTTRGMIVTTLHRMEGSPPATGDEFVDVPADQYYSNAVAWASANDIISGYGNGIFGPNDTITREQMAAILYRYAQYKGYGSESEGDISAFSDGSQVSSYAVKAMNWAVDAGLISGVDSNILEPKGSATRAQVAVILMRFCNSVPPASYTVTFEYNYGSKGVYKTVTVEKGKTVDKPAAPTRGGYSFEGWYTAEKNGAKFDFDTIISKDITLYAKWAEISSSGSGVINTTPSSDPQTYYTITFDSNGGNEIPTQNIVAGNTATVPSAPAKEGYVFEAWYSDEALTALYDFALPVNASITLYAKWSEANNMITGSASSVDVFFVSKLKINKENGEAVATVSAPENCALVIRFIEEDLYFSDDYPANKEYISEDTLYASHVVRAGTDMEEIVVDIAGELPEHYVAEAVLMDGDGNLLCNPFASIEHTQRYEQFKQKTVDDFDDGDTVLKFGQTTDNDFGVLADDVKIIHVEDLTVDEPNNVYYLTGVTDTIEAGDKLFITDGADHALIRAKEVSETSGIIMVVPASADDDILGFTLEDFYKFIKVDMVYAGDLETADTPYDAEYASAAAMSREIIDTDVSAETSLSVNPIKFETDHFKASGKVDGKISANLVMEWDLVLFGKDYMRCDFTYSTDLNANITVVGKWGNENDEELQEELKNKKEEKELRLGKVRIPFGVTGLDAFADIKACVEWKITAGLELDGKIKTTHGFKYNTKDGYQKIDKKESTWSVNCKGHAEISFGPKPSVGVEFLNGVISCELECFFGTKAEADAVVPVFQGGTSKHSCYLCIDGNLKMVFSVDAKLKYKITDHLKGTPIDLNIVTIERLLFDFYISLLNAPDSMFGGHLKLGKGSCPNESFKTEFYVYDETGDLYDAPINITEKSHGTTIASVDSGDTEYLYDGNYIASTQIGSTAINRTFTVSGEAQIIKLNQSTRDGSISGVVKNATNLAAIVNATVSVYKGSILCASTKTAADGSYSISLAEGSYKYIISAENFVSASGYITVNNGETKYMESTLMARDDDESIMGGVYGTIKDAQTGLPLSGVKVGIYYGANNTTSTSPATDIIETTGSDGEYAYITWSVFGVTFGLPAGNYTAVLSKDGYITSYFNIVVVAGENTVFNGSISPVTAENEYRVVLTWGENPRDLDSHYTAKSIDGSVEHVYYSAMFSASAMLDTDDTTSYGPETVYVNNIDSLEDGFYYCVHDYTNRNSSNSYALSNSGAIVQLYRGATLIATYYVPAGQGGTVWNVLSISRDGTVTPINTMSYESDSYNVGMDLVTDASALSADGEFLRGQRHNTELKDYELLLVEP